MKIIQEISNNLKEIIRLMKIINLNQKLTKEQNLLLEKYSKNVLKLHKKLKEMI
jgi:hypothetical protein